MHSISLGVTTTERMARYRFAIGAVLTVCYHVIYLELMGFVTPDNIVVRLATLCLLACVVLNNYSQIRPQAVLTFEDP